MHGWCTDHGREKEGTTGTNQEGLAKCNEMDHSIIHREALASRQLSPEINKVLTDVVNMVNFIKQDPESAPVLRAL